jgi:hypothetical protein
LKEHTEDKKAQDVLVVDHAGIDIGISADSSSDIDDTILDKLNAPSSNFVIPTQMLVLRQSPGAIFPLLRTKFLYMRKDKCVLSSSPSVVIAPWLVGSISSAEFDVCISSIISSANMDPAFLFALLNTLSDYSSFFNSKAGHDLVDRVISCRAKKESRVCAAVLVRCGLNPFQRYREQQSPINEALVRKNYAAFEGFVSIPCRGYALGDFSYATFNFVVLAYVCDFHNNDASAIRVCARMFQTALEIRRVSASYPVHEAESVHFAFYVLGLFFGKCPRVDLLNVEQVCRLPNWDRPILKKIVGDMHALYLK